MHSILRNNVTYKDKKPEKKKSSMSSILPNFRYKSLSHKLLQPIETGEDGSVRFVVKKMINEGESKDKWKELVLAISTEGVGFLTVFHTELEFHAMHTLVKYYTRGKDEIILEFAKESVTFGTPGQASEIFGVLDRCIFEAFRERHPEAKTEMELQKLYEKAQAKMEKKGSSSKKSVSFDPAVPSSSKQSSFFSTKTPLVPPERCHINIGCKGSGISWTDYVAEKKRLQQNQALCLKS